mmetsp:Transcript_31508/g.74305  ORF Transcript_31508/g.74305 Transcript_31508/m.74305 type:complete len:225 (+) Transcript_31508:214-888(+)
MKRNLPPFFSTRSTSASTSRWSFTLQSTSVLTTTSAEAVGTILRSLRMTEGSLKCAAAFSEIAECMYSFGSTAVYVRLSGKYAMLGPSPAPKSTRESPGRMRANRFFFMPDTPLSYSPMPPIALAKFFLYQPCSRTAGPSTSGRNAYTVKTEASGARVSARNALLPTSDSSGLELALNDNAQPSSILCFLPVLASLNRQPPNGCCNTEFDCGAAARRADGCVTT